MALTPEQIDTAYRKVWSTVPHAKRLSAFALEIETEVRKEYTELIRQMLEAIEAETSDAWECSSYHPKLHDAVVAARARLEGKP